MTTILDGWCDRRVLAAQLKCSPRTVARYEKEPNGLPSQMLAGRKLYNLETVKAWLLARERTPNPWRRTA